MAQQQFGSRSTWRGVLGGLVAVCVMSLGAVARAQAPVTLEPGARPGNFAIVVGSNQGSENQPKLRFAESDARRVGDLLTEIGRYEGKNVQTLVAPTATELMRAIRGLGGELTALQRRNEESQLFFYYSGHANAQSLNLGNEELSLQDLRSALEALPTTLTLVVLDACQSGSFSRGKGAEPTADFTYNSVARLTAEGLAVMASSSDDELSQESDELGASYFTHHLVVAMRGAGDDDRDGRVTLDEAYNYAYNQTLRDTTQTAIGGQHVTLETALTGYGSVPLTYPTEADAMLEIGAPLSGVFLVQQPEGGAVMAELSKPAGQSLRLAFPAGEYEVGWRDGQVIKRCTVKLASGQVTSLSASRCKRDMRRSGQSKGLRISKSEALTPKKRRAARTELAIGQTLHGAALGAEICVFADCGNPRVWSGATLLGAGLGLTVSLLATPDGLHPATASIVNSGTLWGVTSSILLFAATSKAFYENDGLTGRQEGRRIAGTLIGGQFGGIGLSILADRWLRPTTGEVAGALGASWWLTGLTALSWGAARYDSEFQERAFFGTLFAVSQLGLVGGYFLADHVEMSRSRALVLHSGGLMGGGLGALATFLIRGNDATGKGFLWASAGGAVVGLGLTYFLTRNFDKPDVPIEVGFAPTPGGAMLQLRLTM